MDVSGLVNVGIILIVVVLVAGLFVWALNQLAPEPLRKVGVVIIVVIAALIMLAMILPLLGVAY